MRYDEVEVPVQNVTQAGIDILVGSQSVCSASASSTYSQDAVARPDLTTAIITESSGLEQLTNEWDELFSRIGCRNAFLSPAWMASWWQQWGGEQQLLTISVRNQRGRLVALAPFYVRHSGIGIWPLRALCFLAHRWVGSDYLNILVDPEHEQPAVDAIVREVGRHHSEWDYIELADGEEADPVFARLRQGFKLLGLTEELMQASACPYAALPSSFEEYLAGLSHNLRYNFGRRRRSLEREAKIEFIALQNASDLHERFGELVRLHRLRFHHQRKYSSFLWPEVQQFHTDTLQRLAHSGRARLFLLQSRGKAIAALYGFSIGKTFSFFQSGMDPAWSRLSTGLVMMGCSIEEAIRTGHDEFDFLRGEEDYKFQWAQNARRTVTVCFFDHRIRSLLSRPYVKAKTESRRLLRRYAGMVQSRLPFRVDHSVLSPAAAVQGKEARTTKPKVQVRAAKFTTSDLKGIWRLCQSSFSMYRTCSFSEFYQLWRHKWLDNPTRTADHSFGWVVEDSENGIVGFIGIVPIRMKIRDQHITGGTPHTWAVSRGYGAYGMSLYKEAIKWGRQRLLVFTTASEVPAKLNAQLKLGLCKIPVSEFDRQLIWLIKPEVPVQWLVAKSASRRWTSLVTRRPGAWLLRIIARMRFFTHRRMWFPDGTLPVEPIKEFTNEFTQFWEEHKHQYGITTVRDRAFLQWRHLDAPVILGTTHVFVCRESGRMLGYLTLMERLQHEGFCPGHFRVTDVFYDRTRPAVVQSLFNHAFAFAKARGCSLFEASNFGTELQSTLRGQTPYMRLVEAWPYWYRAPNQGLAEICERESWWPSGVDGDSNL